MNELKEITAVKREIGKRIIKARKEKGMTYYALSQATGLHQSVLQSIETASKSYTIDSYLKVTKALDVTIPIEDLLNKEFFGK